MSLLNKNNLEVCKFASKSDTRPALSGVFITDKLVVATDSFRLVEMTLPTDVKAEDYPKVEGKTAMRRFKPFIISARELSKIKIQVNKSLPILNHIAINHIDDTRVELMTTNSEMLADVKSFRLIDEQFPDYLRLFPIGDPKVEIEVNAELLAEVLEVMGKLDSTKKVKIKIYSNQQPIVVEAGNSNQTGRAMVMALRQ